MWRYLRKKLEEGGERRLIHTFAGGALTSVAPRLQAAPYHDLGARLALAVTGFAALDWLVGLLGMFSAVQSQVGSIPQQADDPRTPPVLRSSPVVLEAEASPFIQLEVPANPASSPGTDATPGLARCAAVFASTRAPLQLSGCTHPAFRSTLIFWPAGSSPSSATSLPALPAPAIATPGPRRRICELDGAEAARGNSGPGSPVLIRWNGAPLAQPV